MQAVIIRMFGSVVIRRVKL